MSEEIIRSIGHIIADGDSRNRDAIHVAIAPVVAAESLDRGEFVYLDEIGRARKAGWDGPLAIGVVDPFLRDLVAYPGQKFWLFLSPGTIRGLRHEWTHPSFASPPVNSVEPVSEAERWLRAFADKWHFDYRNMIMEASRQGEHRYAVAHGRDLHSAGELGEDEALFWQHIEALTGQQFSLEHRTDFGWSCSC